MKKAFIPLALATALFTTGCKDSENIIDTPSTPDLTDHEAISFSMSDAQAPTTRAGFTTAATDLVMHIESFRGSDNMYRNTLTKASASKDATNNATSYSNVSFDNAYLRYWDDAHGRDSKLSVFAVAVANKLLSETALTESLLGGDASWTANSTTRPTHNITWNVSTGTNMQSTTTMANEDLVYSNNIQQSGTDGIYWFKFDANDGSGTGKWMPGEKAEIEQAKTGAQTHGGNYGESTAGNNLKDGRMQFRLSNTADASSMGKFDRGHLNFTHSLSRINVTLVEGAGFKNDASTDFTITADGIQMIAMNVTGTLNVLDGTWAPTAPAATDITKLSATKDNANTSKISAAGQFIPGDEFRKDNSTNVMKFKIDGNDYFITEHMIWNALQNATDGTNALTSEQKTAAGIGTDKVTFIQGHNYRFSIVVDKKAIETITATLVDWSTVKAEEFNIDNGHINIATFNASGDGTSEINNYASHRLYRLRETVPALYIDNNTYTANSYQGVYGDEITPSIMTGNTSYWSTSWYYENNYTAYHFRSLNATAANNKVLGSGSEKSYFTIENGAQADHDYHWGAPLANATGSVTIGEGSKNTYKYDETDGSDDDTMAEGYKALLYKGITATNKDQVINLTEFHMMANINVVVKTVSDGGKVNLGGCTTSTDRTEVEILRLYDRGQVDMGIGAITITKTNPSEATGYLTTDPNKGVKRTETMTPPSTTTTPADYYEDATSKLQTKPFTFAVVPQPLCRNASPSTSTPEEDYIGIRIKTPDNNEYYVVKRLYDIKATTVGTSVNQANNTEIRYWYPNHSYTYTITISKKQIEAITCTLADWVKVTAEDIPVDLEK